MKEEEIRSEGTEYETGTYPKAPFNSGPCKTSHETSPMTMTPLH